MNLIFIWILMDFELNGINKNCWDVAFAIDNRFSSRNPPNLQLNWDNVNFHCDSLPIQCTNVSRMHWKSSNRIEYTRVCSSQCLMKPKSEQQHQHHHKRRLNYYCYGWNSSQTGRISIEHWAWFPLFWENYL